MKPVERVHSPHRDRDEPPALDDEANECYWAHHENRTTGNIDPHWHCAGHPACKALHLTIEEAEFCPHEPVERTTWEVIAKVSA